MKRYWEIITDNLKKRGWSRGCVSALDSNGRTIWIVDAHRGDGKRFVVRADEKLTAFLELKSAISGRVPMLAGSSHACQTAPDICCLTSREIFSKLDEVKRI